MKRQIALRTEVVLHIVIDIPDDHGDFNEDAPAEAAELAYDEALDMLRDPAGNLETRTEADGYVTATVTPEVNVSWSQVTS